MRGKLLQPGVIILEQPVFGIVDVDGSSDMHRVHETEPFLHIALSASLTAFRYLSDLLVVVARHGFSGDDLLWAALGAYNQGQGRLLQMQSQADADGLDPRLWESILEVAVPVMVAAYGVNDGPKKAKEMQDYIVNILGYFHAYQEAIA